MSVTVVEAMNLKVFPDRIVVASNAWRGTFAARLVSDHVAARIRSSGGGRDAVSVPLADGGDGTLDVLAAPLGLDLMACTVRGPSGDPVTARYGWNPRTRTGVVEMAEASGLGRLGTRPAGILDRTSHGAGQLVAAVLDRGCDRLVYGAGGSATADAGAGLARALGARLLDARGRPLDGAPRTLRALAEVDHSHLHPGARRPEVIVLSDTSVTVGDSLRTFGPQKGVTEGERRPLEEAFRRAASLLHRPVPSDHPWRAAGGASAGTVAGLFETRPIGGAAWVGDLVGLPACIGPGSTVVTSEGRFDTSSLRGKATGWVVERCAAVGATPVVLCATADPAAVAALPPGARVLPVAPAGGVVGLDDIARTAVEALEAHSP